ncbi:MAG: bifunctional diaminohydroxyphosphoribosylaminopyrimidine deaminase/5-amino-6-(5-phosphoribosylamino)uracil reductase RibD [Paracoccaceae bacterium]
MITTDEARMAAALALGRQGRGRTGDNPAVGCAIWGGGRLLASARTGDGGAPHAEAAALARCDARGATAYVTLEPCAHHGRTPPCAEALVAAGVARVVIAAPDPDPRVAGRGAAILRAAGVEVIDNVLRARAEVDLRGFLRRVAGGLPEVTLKLATTLDGRIATASGESRWITGHQARAAVHALRGAHDAVMVGGGTGRADDPMLDVRGMGARPQPIRVVLSRRLDLPRGRLWDTAATIPVWPVHADAAPDRIAAWTAQGARPIEVPVEHGHLSVRAALQALAARGVNRVLCEGGGTLSASLIQAGLVDRLELFTAGAAIGAEGTPGLGAMGLSALAQAPRARLIAQRAVGPDLWSTWTF